MQAEEDGGRVDLITVLPEHGNAVELREAEEKCPIPATNE